MSARKKSDLTYAQASAELEEILDAIESGTADVDVLSEKVERAAELIRYCRETLAGTELRVRKVVEDLAQPESPTESEED
jgi:exodeoxyribonuclease VII small subunit